MTIHDNLGLVDPLTVLHFSGVALNSRSLRLFLNHLPNGRRKSALLNSSLLGGQTERDKNHRQRREIQATIHQGSSTSCPNQTEDYMPRLNST